MAKLNICMIGHGMMGTWHSEALTGSADAALYSVVGKSMPDVSAFAERYGYQRASTDWQAAIADPAVDAVIVTSPSEDHARMTLGAIEAGKPVLAEIPLAMSLAAAERVVEAAETRAVPLAVCHPMRFRTCRHDMIRRIDAGEERPSHVHGRFFIHRLVNIGATGIRRAWTDNILWHHTTHLIDFGLFLLGGGDPVKAAARIRRIDSVMPDIDPRTGIPMEIVLTVETEDAQTIVATGSYYAPWRIYDMLAVTDRDANHVDELTATMTASDGKGGKHSTAIETEQENAWRVARDFVASLQAGRPPFVTGRSVLPVLGVLEHVQRDWDARFGARALPGRPLDEFAAPPIAASA